MRRKRATEKKDREITFESKWVRQGIKRWTKKKNSFQQSSSHFFMLMNSWVSGSSLEEIERRLCRTSLCILLIPSLTDSSSSSFYSSFFSLVILCCFPSLIHSPFRTWLDCRSKNHVISQWYQSLYCMPGKTVWEQLCETEPWTYRWRPLSLYRHCVNTTSCFATQSIKCVNKEPLENSSLTTFNGQFQILQNDSRWMWQNKFFLLTIL